MACDREKYREYQARWRKNNLEKARQDARDWYHKNKHTEKYKKYREKIKEKRYQRARDQANNNIKDWKEYFTNKYGVHPLCQICGKKLSWLGNKNKVVHFDHRNGTEKIKIPPHGWIRSHSHNAGNIAIFESCNFGILCSQCNQFLPTENREIWIENVIQYINYFRG